ncbi:MAG TPA: DUF2877 domain-containing protein [Nocardioidaceae bacterium]|nr:DUF2877 domain-containing protein [Nocardioidaceae bacterium]
MTRQSPPRDVPGAGSPLTQTVVAGPQRQALVLATFPSALYLSVGDHHEVLPIVTSDALMLPTAVRLSVAARELEWGVQPGDTVAVGRAEIRLPALHVRVVREWRPARVRVVPLLPEPRLLSELADRLSTHLRTPELMDQATAVCRAARSGDDAGVRRGTRQLLGAGLGLTPSGDDVLCAVLLVLCGVGDPAPIALLGAAVQDRWSATTSLSASLLQAARQGYAVPEVAALVEYALRGDLAGAHEALTPTLAIGHSSGQDLVAGLAGSLRVLAATNARPDESRTLQPAGRRNP